MKCYFLTNKTLDLVDISKDNERNLEFFYINIAARGNGDSAHLSFIKKCAAELKAYDYPVYEGATRQAIESKIKNTELLKI